MLALLALLACFPPAVPFSGRKRSDTYSFKVRFSRSLSHPFQNMYPLSLVLSPFILIKTSTRAPTQQRAKWHPVTKEERRKTYNFSFSIALDVMMNKYGSLPISLPSSLPPFDSLAYRSLSTGTHTHTQRYEKNDSTFVSSSLIFRQSIILLPPSLPPSLLPCLDSSTLT